MTEQKQPAKRAAFDYNAVPDKQTRAFLRKKAEYGKAILKRTAQGVWEMGQLLSEVKEALPYGDFGNWIESEFGMSWDSANRFMNVFRQFQITQIAETAVAPSVLYELAKPSVSDDDREAAVELIQSGDIKTVADVKTAISPPKSPETDTESNSPTARVAQDLPDSSTGFDSPNTDTSANDADYDFGQGDDLEPDDTTEASGDYEDDERAALSDESEQTGSSASTGSTGTTTQSSSVTTSEPSIHERIEALPLAQALAKFKHKGRIFRDQAEIYYEQHYAIKAAQRSLTAIRYTTGPVTDAIKALAVIPEPEKWQGCATCKGSLRFGENADPCPRCKGGFTIHTGEGVSADVISSFADQCNAESV